MNRIEFDSSCLKQRFFSSYRETTNCVLSMFFFSDRNYNNADLAIISSESSNCSLFSVALLLCRGTWLIELVEKLGLRPPILFFSRHSRGTLWYDLCYRRTVVVDVCVISYEYISVCGTRAPLRGRLTPPATLAQGRFLLINMKGAERRGP